MSGEKTLIIGHEKRVSHIVKSYLTRDGFGVVVVETIFKPAPYQIHPHEMHELL